MLKQRIKKFVRQIAEPAFRKELKSQKLIARVYQDMLENVSNWNPNGVSCEGIVFSKDRAMQLHTLLSSYFALVKNPCKLHVLYTTTNERHAKTYEELKKIFAGKEIVFVREEFFKRDLEKLLDSIHAAKLFFMTDDGVFIDSFDMDDVVVFDSTSLIPSPIKGLDLTYCYIQDRQQAIPTFINPPELKLQENMKCWEWGKAEPGSDWAYPLSLDLSFYNKMEMTLLIKNISYKAPNSLETALHQSYSPVFLQRKGLCFEKAKYVNIVCNIVNTEHANRSNGLHSIESLLEKWENGFCIDYEIFLGKNCGEVEQSPLSFVKR